MANKKHLSQTVSQNPAQQDCEPTAAMKASNFYDVPCSLIITVKGPPYPAQSEVQQILKPINGEMNPIDPRDGIYAVKVRAGSEKQALDYLKSQPAIDSATQNHCCVGPN